jgi:hypothetical protein
MVGDKMSITMITGVPGAGKTYWAVHQLLIAKAADKYAVYHNIPGLNLNYFTGCDIVHWPELVNEETHPGDLFSKEEQIKLCNQVMSIKQKPILFIIDEAGAILSKANDEYFRWLSWNRHIGQDIWIIVQDRTMIHRSFRNLVEIEIKGVKNRVVNMFLYSHRVGRTQFRQQRLRKEQSVFNAYKSFDLNGVKPKTSYMIYMGILMGVIGLGSIGYVATAGVPKMLAHRDRTNKESKEVRTMEKAPTPEKQNSTVNPVKYSYAGTVGHRVLIQTQTGNLMDISSIVGDYIVVQSDSRQARILDKTGTIFLIVKNHAIIKVQPSPPTPPAATPASTATTS